MYNDLMIEEDGALFWKKKGGCRGNVVMKEKIAGVFDEGKAMPAFYQSTNRIHWGCKRLEQ